MDEKADDLNHLRWEAAKVLAQLHADGMTIDQLAEQLNRKPADVRSYVSTWKCYGHDVQVRTEQTYSGLQRLTKRYPDDPKARDAIIKTAREQKISVATALDHLSYSRGGGGGIRGGKRGKGATQDPLIAQLLAAGAPMAVEQMWFALDTALHYAKQVTDDDAALPPAVASMVAGRIDRLRSIWAKAEQTAELAAMASGEMGGTE